MICCKSVKTFQSILRLPALMCVMLFSVQADDVVAGGSSRPPRPDRPANAASGRPNWSEVKAAIKNAHAQKVDLIQQQRAIVRAQVADTATTVTLVRQELRESLVAAKIEALEQARKIVTEAAETAASSRRNKE